MMIRKHCQTCLFLFLILMLFLTLLSAIPARAGSGSPSPAALPPLHVSGTRLLDPQDQPVQLKGISTHGIAWFPQYINADLFQQFHDEWHANVIRLAMYTAESGGYCQDGDQEYLKDLLDQGIRCATAAQMYVIVDWHILSDNDPNQHLEESLNFFDEISEKYKDYDNILYEICNEPNGSTTWQDIRHYALSVIPVIRAHDPDAVIIIGTPNWSQYVDQAAAEPITEYDNLMYTLHFYAATHKQDLRDRMVSALDAGLPIFVTEYGICDASGNGALDLTEAQEWVRLMDEKNISYVNWNLSNKAESSAMLLPSCTKTSDITAGDLSESGLWLFHTLSGTTPPVPSDTAAQLEEPGTQAGMASVR